MILSCACGDDDPQPSDASVRDAARDADTSDASSTPMPDRPAIPTPRVESCSALAPQYAGSGCTRSCASVRCTCKPFPSSYIACHPERGCLTAVDCNVACERELSDVVQCVGHYAPCESDADCKNDGRCVKAGSEPGDCTTGVTGAACLDDADCRDGSCVATASDGTRTCQSGLRGEKCNQADECDAGLACVLPKASFVGS
ncbi:MAG TPA: hypothetical protein VJR89_31565, partial [Polyangiales bacterium]|nr:hypothetical protein [Polyangiales bacterium]